MKILPLSEEWLGDLCALWNQELGNHFPMSKTLFLQNSFLDQNVLPSGSWLVVKGDRVIAFVIAKVWREKISNLELGNGRGWIQVLLVDSHYRKQGIGSVLLAGAEMALEEAGVDTILLGRDPWHYFPGIPTNALETEKWFAKRGYIHYATEYDLYRNFNVRVNSNSKVRDFSEFYNGNGFRLLREHEGEKLIAFLQRSFPGRWEYEGIKYFERGGTGREFVVLEKDGELIGFCRINDAKSPYIAQNVYWSPLFTEELGGIGPLGIAGEHRKSGYGLQLVQAAIHFLRQRGINQIVIDWTTLLTFYGKLGFQVWKSYHSYLKKI